MNGITTKFIAALAVFAMVFAGVGAMAFAENNDAAAAEEETSITVTNVDKDVYVSIDMAPVAVGKKVVADVLKGVKEDVAIYDGASIFVKGVFTGVVYDDEATIPSYLASYISVEGKTSNATLTITADVASYEGIQNSVLGLKDGDKYVFAADDNAPLIVLTGDAEGKLAAEIELSYYASVNFVVEDAITGLFTEEELQDAIAAAVAIVEASYAGYLSPAEVEKACQAAVQKYIDEHPVVMKEDKTFFYAFVVALILAIALAAALTYFYVIPTMRAKKAVEEPPKA